MRRSATKRIVALGCVAAWTLPPVFALAVSMHLAGGHHEHGHEQVERCLAAAVHGHSHHDDTPGHGHEFSAPVLPSATAPAQHAALLAVLTSGPALTAVSSLSAAGSQSCRGAPRPGKHPLHQSLCVFLI